MSTNWRQKYHECQVRLNATDDELQLVNAKVANMEKELAAREADRKFLQGQCDTLREQSAEKSRRIGELVRKCKVYSATLGGMIALCKSAKDILGMYNDMGAEEKESRADARKGGAE